MIDYEKYLEPYKKNPNQYKERRGHINSLKPSIKEDLTGFLKGDITDVFGDAYASRARFQGIKKTLLEFIVFALEQGYIDDETAAIGTDKVSKLSYTKFEKNILFIEDSKFDSIEEIISFFKHMAKEEDYLENDFDIYVIQIILLWYGIKFGEIKDIKISDIDFEKKKINFNNKTYYIDDKSIDIIKRFINAPYVRRYPNGKIESFNRGEYLICGSKSQHLSFVAVANQFKFMVELAKRYNKVISPKGIELNGIFVKTYLDKAEFSKESLKGSSLNKSVEFVNVARRAYEKWATNKIKSEQGK